MTASTFKILKQCLMCGNMFEAQKVSTLYCSHKCNSRHYKLKKKLERKEHAELPFVEPTTFKPRAKAIDRAMIKDKEFLTVRDISILFGCSRPTVYKLINTGKLKAKNIGLKQTYVRRSDIDKLFQ